MRAQQQDFSYFNIFGKKVHKAWIILVGCCFLQAGGVGAILLPAGVFYIPVCEELGFARSEVSLWMTAYFLATIPSMPIAGKLFSRYSIRPIMSISILAIAITMGSISVYTELWQWIMSGVLVGAFGACVLMMPSAVMIANWFNEKSGLAMGVSACSSALAGSLFSPIFQSLITTIGWRTTYIIEAMIIVILCLPWALFIFRLNPVESNALPYGSGLPSESQNEKETVDLRLQGVSWKKAIKTLPFLMVFLFVSVAAFLGSGFDAHMPGIAVTFGHTTAFGALMISALQMGSFTDKLLMGILNDKIGVQKTVYLELVLVALGILGLLFLRNEYLLLVAAFIFGVQDSLIAVSAPLVTKQIFGIKDYVQLYSWLRVGVGIFGSFASVMVGLSFDLTASFMPVLIVALVLCLFGMVFIGMAYKFRKTLFWEDA